MSLLAKHSYIKEDKSDIITLGVIAKECKLKDPETVNATIGMLYDEEGKFFTFKSVEKAVSLLSKDEKFAYSSTPGSVKFQQAVKEWVFQGVLDDIAKEAKISVMATPGGTGAVSNTIANYLNPHDKVLLPSWMWSNYKQIAYEYEVGYETYELFDENNGLNLDDIYAKMLKLKETQKRILIIVNDPCHNPTGYSMTKEEWEALIDAINKVTDENTPVILLHDLAYIDYDDRGINYCRNNLKLYTKLKDSAMAILAFSGSKAFGLYGLRIGAQIAISKNETNIREFNDANQFSSRAKWSNSSMLGINIVTKLITDANLKEEYLKELATAKELVNKRSQAFLKASLACGLKTLPFNCGFFVTVPCQNPKEIYEKLKKEKIHIIPLDNAIRITIAAISIKECAFLPEKIKQAL